MKTIKFLIFLSFYTMIVLYFAVPKLATRPDLVLIDMYYLSKNDLNKNEFFKVLEKSEWFIKTDENVKKISHNDLWKHFKDINSTTLFGVYDPLSSFFTKKPKKERSESN
ncbi:hypothetical protein [Campylobacter ureolyticus]|uniref:Uncharacterized protein n=1 Tax=Campylobacter ureolyticus TaxID=827 RepID=A0AAE7EBE6_9BACT|nr:hypothetical protein [Campylobacter ureolyticus]MCR8685623.1 hypothetical protein [Campylobacter ureolyticus]QKF85096.1 hypothetical protein CURT_1668 [Campylobacter ureolyticus]QQY36422.1 hypothetical protein I6I59_04140 [Campylobacter ureolyticus]SUX25601.1 Uncharacterised protein [Campylobacter ureolyticus]